MVSPLNAEVLISIGLLVDIFGAVLLAVPDIPPIARKFEFGRFRNAEKSLRYGGLESGDVGFEEVVNIHDESKPNTDINPEDVDHVEYGPQLEPVLLDGEVRKYEVNSKLSIDYEDYGPDDAAVAIGHLESPPEYYYPKFKQRIERGERRFRLLGVLLIGLGFSLQLLSTVFY